MLAGATTVVFQADHDSRLAEVAQHTSNLEICFKLGRYGLYQQVLEKGERLWSSASGSLSCSALEVGFRWGFSCLLSPALVDSS